MPVPFKGESEYDANFRWLDSMKSATCHLAPEQEAPRAGLGSVNLGRPIAKSASLPIEPPIQRRMKPLQIEPTSTTEFVTDGGDADSYILIGDQSKFGQSVKYRNLKNTNKSPARKTYKVFKHDHSPPPEPALPRRPVSPPPKPKSAPPASPPPAPRPQEPRQSRSEPVVPKRSKSSPPPEKRRSTPSPKRSRSPAPKPAHEPTRMNAFVQTNMNKGLADSGPEATADYGMRYKAGIAPKRPEGIKRVSEYKKAFEWRDPVKVSPLLAAEQVVYKSDSALGPYKSSVPRKTTYESEFKKIVPRVVNEDVSPKKDEGPSPKKKTKVVKKQLTEEEKKALKESVNPQKPFFPHGKHRRTKSEYASNFQAPAAYSYCDGAWKGANPAHIFPQKETVEPAVTESSRSWYQEVLELRRRAEDYKKRAYGTHFSRSHVGQLLAKNADLWDTASESARTVTAMSLETGSQVASQKGSQRGDSPKKEELREVKKKLAWTQAKQRRDQSPPSVIQQGSVSGSASNNRSNYGTQESQIASDADTLVEEEIGRIPTPRLRADINSGRRHHLDITTPSVGGALLVSPPPRPQNEESLNVSLREEPSKHLSARSSLLDDDSDDDADDDETPRLPPRKVVSKHRDIASQTRVIRPRKTVSAPSPPRPEAHCSCGADDERAPVQSKKTFKKTYKVSPRSAPSPTFGKPTDDNCPLVDEEASTDRALETEFVRSQDFELGNKPASMNEEQDDDILSLSIRSIASSCSLASETLERAARNRDDFWGGRKGATVR